MVLRCIKRLPDSEREIKEICFDFNIESLKYDNLNIYEGVKSDVMYTDQYNENSDILIDILRNA